MQEDDKKVLPADMSGQWMEDIKPDQKDVEMAREELTPYVNAFATVLNKALDRVVDAHRAAKEGTKIEGTPGPDEGFGGFKLDKTDVTSEEVSIARGEFYEVVERLNAEVGKLFEEHIPSIVAGLDKKLGISAKFEELDLREAALDKREEKIEKYVDQKKKALEQREEAVHKAEGKLHKRQEKADAEKQELEALRKKLELKDATLHEKGILLRNMEEKLGERERAAQEKEREIEEKENALGKMALKLIDVEEKLGVFEEEKKSGDKGAETFITHQHTELHPSQKDAGDGSGAGE